MSCGLALPGGVTPCPGCAQLQHTTLAEADQARCSVHLDVASAAPCPRCGRFMCTACHSVDAGVCRTCLAPSLRDAVKKMQSLTVRIGALTVLQGTVAPLSAWLWGNTQLTWFVGILGIVSVSFGLVTIATKEMWSIGIAAAALIGFFSFFALFTCPPLFICFVLLMIGNRMLGALNAAEREVFLLQK